VNGIVVDAPVTLSWCFAEEQTPLSLIVLDRLNAGEAAVVPAFWSLEILNSLLVGARRGRISRDQTHLFLCDIGALQLTLDHESFEQVSRPVQTLCHDHRITPYDALYIELAIRLQCPLVTLDRLQQKPAKELGVECL
jgi:predicted nucleic acid-binding protein